VGSVCRSLHVLEILLPQKSAAAALSKPICIVAAGFPRAKAGAAAAALYRRRGVGPASVRCSRASLPRSPMAATAAAAAPPRRARPRGARPHRGGAELATAALLARLRAAAAPSSPARGDGAASSGAASSGASAPWAATSRAGAGEGRGSGSRRGARCRLASPPSCPPPAGPPAGFRPSPPSSSYAPPLEPSTSRDVPAPREPVVAPSACRSRLAQRTAGSLCSSSARRPSAQRKKSGHA